MKSHLTLRQLEIFLAVVRLGSFRQAGLSLNLAPVVISEHIRALEARLGADLFQRRSGSAAVLTPLGERVVGRAREVLAAVELLEDELVLQKQQSEWRFCLMPFMARHLAGRITELRRRYPGSLLITEMADKSAIQMAEEVSRGDCDLAMTIADEDGIPETTATAEVRVVIEEPLALFAAHNHPLAHRRALTVEDCKPYPLATLTKRHPLRTVVDSALAGIGLANQPCSLETDDYNEILRVISGSSSIGCLFAEAGSSDGEAFRLRALPIGFHLPAAQAVMIVSKRARTDQRLRVAADFLANHYRFDTVAARR